MSTKKPDPKPEEKALAKTERALAPQEARFQKIRDVIDGKVFAAKLAQVAPKNFDPVRATRIALAAVNKNPDLTDCTPTSWMIAMFDLARMGLEPGGRVGGAYLIPRERSVKTGDDRWIKVKEVNVQTDYRGEILLAMRGGTISDVWPRLVYEKDTFEVVEGAHPDLIHRPNPFGDRGKLLGGYAVVRFKDGTVRWSVMTKEQIDARKKRGRASERGPWATDYEAMCLKTLIRDVLRPLPVANDYAEVVEAEERRDEKGEDAAPGLFPETYPDLLDAPPPKATSSATAELEAELAGDVPPRSIAEEREPTEDELPLRTTER